MITTKLEDKIGLLSLYFSGFEISDVLGINDRDFSITFGLYFSAEWMEPRLNLSTDLWGEENVATEQELVPGGLDLLIF